MQKKSTPDYVRGLAGSLISKITNLPVISEISDAASGSYGHVNVVLPAPSRVYAGDAGSSVSFMSTIPVDGQKIRNSLWLTQVMRSSCSGHCECCSSRRHSGPACSAALRCDGRKTAVLNQKYH